MAKKKTKDWIQERIDQQNARLKNSVRKELEKKSAPPLDPSLRSKPGETPNNQVQEDQVFHLIRYQSPDEPMTYVGFPDPNGDPMLLLFDDMEKLNAVADVFRKANPTCEYYVDTLEVVESRLL